MITTAGGGFEGDPFECRVDGVSAGSADYYAPIYYTVPTVYSAGAVLTIYCFQPSLPDSSPWAGSTTFFVTSPDSDGDGIPDDQDACPFEFGASDNKGCPLPTETPTRIPATRVPPTATPTPTATPDTRLTLPTDIDLSRLVNCPELVQQTASLSRVQMLSVLNSLNSDAPCARATASTPTSWPTTRAHYSRAIRSTQARLLPQPFRTLASAQATPTLTS